MNAWTAAASIMILVSGAIATSQAQQPSTTLSPAALKEIAEVEAEIDRIEAQTLERLTAPPNNQVQQVELLGKSMLYDKQLSVNRNEACAFCHMPETGFTGPVSELNRTTGSYPGSVRTRFSNRKPQIARLRAALARSALQSRPGRSRRRQFLGHACDRPSVGQSCGRAGRGAADQSRRNGAARYCLCGVPRVAAAVSRAVRKRMGSHRRSPSSGPLTWSRCAISRARRRATTRCRSILRSSIAAAPLPPSIRWRSPSPATRPPRR